MKINTETVLLGLDGKPLKTDKQEDLTVGKAVSAILTLDKNEFIEPMKAWILAQRFYSQAEVDLDRADFASLKDAIRTNPRWTPQVVGQILSIFDGIKEDEAAPAK